MNASDIAREAPGPAIAVDRENRILAVNRPARDLLGFSRRASLVGKPLFGLLEGRDVFGNRLADRVDGFWEMISHREPVRSFEITVRKASGGDLRVTVHVLVVLGPGDEHRSLTYLLTPVLRRRKADEAIERLLSSQSIPDALVPDEPPKPPAALTPRQTEVLRLLTRGANVDEIAGVLGISVHTARTHVQRILEALGVHSQVEAVARAFRERLI
jgi:DNA-binding CsgD family transcriptional regulator